VARGREVINSLQGGGGTEMLDALKKVLEFPKDPERLRIVLFMTDGYIGNDPQILAFVKEHLNGSRIFPLGVGSSPNRYLLDELAVLGKGTVQYVRQDEKPAKLEKMIERFYDRISKPVLTDLSVDWKGLDVADASPAVLHDLFAGQPVFIHARYKGAGSAAVTLRGKMKGQPWEMPVRVNLPARETANAALGPLWARSRITELGRAMYGRQDDGLKEKITELALEHKLVSAYTSFVAVDESTAAAGQAPLLVPVESELPEGTRYEGFFGGAAGRAVASVRGSFSQAKFMAASAPLSSVGFAFRAGGSGSGLRQAESEVKAVDAAVANGDSRVAAIAGELLAQPSSRLLRQLISLQENSGAFVEPDGRAVSLADHALAVLALAKAKAELGAEADGALQRAWGHLRAKTPAGLGAKMAVTNALKGGPYLGRSAVLGELEAQAALLAELK